MSIRRQQTVEAAIQLAAPVMAEEFASLKTLLSETGLDEFFALSYGDFILGTREAKPEDRRVIKILRTGSDSRDYSSDPDAYLLTGIWLETVRQGMYKLYGQEWIGHCSISNAQSLIRRRLEEIKTVLSFQENPTSPARAYALMFHLFRREVTRKNLGLCARYLRDDLTDDQVAFFFAKRATISAINKYKTLPVEWAEKMIDAD